MDIETFTAVITISNSNFLTLDSVDLLETQTGWSVLLAANGPDPAGPALTLSYKDELKVKLFPKLFTSSQSAMEVDGLKPVELSYISGTAGTSSYTITPAKSLILSSLQTNISSITPSRNSLKQLLAFISDAWSLAYQLEEEIRVLNFQGVTKAVLLEKADAGPVLRVRCILVGSAGAEDAQQRSRVDVDFHITPRISQQKDDAGKEAGNLTLDTDVAITKVYGFTQSKKTLSDGQMRDAILHHLGTASKGKKESKSQPAKLGQGLWGKSVGALVSKAFA